MQVRRIVYIDWLKAFAIFLVLLGHSIQKLSAGGVMDGLFDFIYSFHMPLFMMLSGFFLAKSLDCGIKRFLITRSRQLLLPVLSFSVVAFAVSKTIPYLDITDGLGFFAYLVGGDMWFLKYLFVCTLIAYLSDRLFRIRFLAAVIPSVLLVSLSRVGIFRIHPFLWMGYYIHKYEKTIFRHTKWLLPVAVAVFIFLLHFWQMKYDTPHFRFVTIKHGISLSWYDLGVVVYRFAIGVFGSLVFLCIFKIIRWDAVEKRFHAFSTFCLNAGRRTLGIYCLQVYLLEDVARCVTLPAHGIVADVAIVSGVAVAEFIMCNILVGLMEKCRLTRLLFLGQR